MARTNTSRSDSAVPWLFLRPALIFVATVGLATVAVQTPTVAPHLTVLASLSLLFVVPGYAIVTVLFPPGRTTATSDRPTRAIERLSLSVVGSVLTTAFVGFALVLSPLALSRGNIVFLLTSVVTIAVLFISRAQLRRRGDPVDRTASSRVELFDGWQRQPPTTKVVTVLLVTGLLFATGAMSHALATDTRGEQYTEFYLATENESGQLVASDYPTEFTRGDSRSVTVGVTNREQSTVQYSVVVELQRLQRTDNETAVVEREELTRYETRLRPAEAGNRSVQIQPSMVGTDLRLTFFLYTGDPPADPTAESAYRDIHLWVTVSPSG